MIVEFSVEFRKSSLLYTLARLSGLHLYTLHSLKKTLHQGILYAVLSDVRL